MVQRDGLLPYNKNSADKRRPTIMASPRQRQRKAVAEDLSKPIIADLTAKLEAMATELTQIRSTAGTKVPDGANLYTEDELNQAVNEAVTEALMKEISKSEDVDKYKKEIADLKLQLEIKTALIEELKTLNFNVGGFVAADNSASENTAVKARPVISDNIVVDPSEDSGLESHINIDEVPDETTSSKEEVDNKLAKLRELGLG